MFNMLNSLYKTGQASQFWESQQETTGDVPGAAFGIALLGGCTWLEVGDTGWAWEGMRAGEEDDEEAAMSSGSSAFLNLSCKFAKTATILRQ